MKKLIIGIVVLLVLALTVIIISMSYKKNKPITSIKHFSFHFTTGYARYSYVIFEIDCDEKCMAKIKPDGVAEEDATELEIEDETVQEVIDLLNKYRVPSWDGFDKVDKYVLDGNSFSLSLRTKEDRSISSSGYMRWPRNYSEVKSGLQKIYEKLLKTGN